MKIYISEKDMLKRCQECNCMLNSDTCAFWDEGMCDIAYEEEWSWEECYSHCPLQSLEKHDQEVRREFAEELKQLKECFLEGMGNGQYVEKYYVAVEDIDNLLKQYEVEE